MNIDENSDNSDINNPVNLKIEKETSKFWVQKPGPASDERETFSDGVKMNEFLLALMTPLFLAAICLFSTYLIFLANEVIFSFLGWILFFVVWCFVSAVFYAFLTDY